MENSNSIDVVKNQKSYEGHRKHKIISLFSCCGGMDLGFEGGFSVFGQEYSENPFEVVFASDISKPTTKTYNHNFSHQSHNIDINNLDVNDLPEADIVIGGFPCQPFSHAGRRDGFSDTRGQLYLQMKRVIDHVRPKMFIAENVDGLRTKKHGTDTTALEQVVEDFKSSGYEVVYKVMKAVDYGVPQTRVRIIIIGKRADLKGEIYYPEPTHGNDILSGLKPYRTTYDAIDDLWDKLDTGIVPNHMSKDYSNAKFYPGSKSQGNAMAPKDKPAQTVRAEAHGNQYAHYRVPEGADPADMTAWRRMTVRECARLQSFPDTFELPVAQSEAHKQVGNAVPPVLAWFIARACIRTLES